MSDAVYNVGARETGSRRHKLLGNGFLTTKRVHAIRFGAEDCAAEAAAWLFDNNHGAIDSTQVRDAETGRLVRQVRGGGG
jgi:phage gp46-like protein